MEPEIRQQREELSITMTLRYGKDKSVVVKEVIKQCDDGPSATEKFVAVTGFDSDTGSAIKRAVDVLPMGVLIGDIEKAVTKAVGE